MIKVVKPGLLTTVQDLGRSGYQQYGIVVGGALDALAARAANLILGNADNAAVITRNFTSSPARSNEGGFSAG